jgi:hypothetical protein
MTDTVASPPAGAVLELLSRRPLRGYFIVEIGESLRRAGILTDGLEDALASLESSGSILIRSNACADPHLDGADLRIAALIDADESDRDAQAAAGSLIDRTWQRWIGDYLANHRCM